MKEGLKLVALGHMDALQNFFFWSWKIGNSSVTNAPVNPMWSYQLGLQEGYMPADPRSAIGYCQANQNANGGSYTSVPWAGTFSAWQTGGVGAGTLAPSATSAYTVWPPVSYSNYPDANLLPTYAPTGKVITLKGSASPGSAYPTGSPTKDPGDGWFQPTDTAGWYTKDPACTYVDPWEGNTSPVVLPTADLCGGAGAKRLAKKAPKPVPTQPPLARMM